MNNSNKNRFEITPRHVLWLGAIVYIAILGLLVREYFSSLKPGTVPLWSESLYGYLVLIPAICAAVAGTLLTGQFEKGEAPRRIWLAFSAGLWCWVAGEIAGTVFSSIYSETILKFHIVDVFWLLGYFFLGLSLYYQVSLVYGGRKKQGMALYLGLFTLALLIAAALAGKTANAVVQDGDDSWFGMFLTVLYPLLDLTEGAIAIWLSFLFGRGQWSRPWWGLILFALTDGIDAFYWMGGYEKIPLIGQSALDVISLITYPASYMVAGLALLANYFMLRYGLTRGWLSTIKKSGLNMNNEGK